MSKIFDALRKAEESPSPLYTSSELGLSDFQPHPRQQRIYEEEFSGLSNALQSYFPRVKRGKVILVLGCVEGEGATYVAAHLSRTLARDVGAPVLFLDGNFHADGMRQEFQSANDLGLSDIAKNGHIKDLSGVIQAAETKHLYLLSSGRTRVSPVAYFNSPHFEKSLEALRKTFKFVVVDGPPLIKHPDAIHLATHMDGVVFVVRHKHLPREIVRKGVEMVESVQAPILGAVLNRRKFSIPSLIYKLIS